MQFAPRLKALCTEYKGKALFAAVYIAEAHAADEWPVGARISVCNQTKSVDERTALAKTFASEVDLQFPMLIDTMANHFMDVFAAWPFRFYIVQHGKVVLKAMPQAGEFGYDQDVIGEWLAANVQ